MHKAELLVGLTGKTGGQVAMKLRDAEKRKLKRATLFLEVLQPSQRQRVYDALESSSVRELPMVHIRNDMKRDELKLLVKEYGAEYMTIHENTFSNLEKWKGYYKHLFLELNYDNMLSHIVNVRKVGGFCIDLSHFKADEEKWSKEFEYVLRNRKGSIVGCNHLNGYSYARNQDLHTVRGIHDFLYLKTLPEFVFGRVIGMEMFNTVDEQLKFKTHIKRMLRKRVITY